MKTKVFLFSILFLLLLPVFANAESDTDPLLYELNEQLEEGVELTLTKSEGGLKYELDEDVDLLARQYVNVSCSVQSGDTVCNWTINASSPIQFVDLTFHFDRYKQGYLFPDLET